jgi:hypothetical protein
LLLNGQVLAAGGQIDGFTQLDSAELYSAPASSVPAVNLMLLH